MLAFAFDVIISKYMKVLDVPGTIFLIKGKINNRGRLYNGFFFPPELNINVYTYTQTKKMRAISSEWFVLFCINHKFTSELYVPKIQ